MTLYCSRINNPDTIPLQLQYNRFRVLRLRRRRSTAESTHLYPRPLGAINYLEMGVLDTTFWILSGFWVWFFANRDFRKAMSQVHFNIVWGFASWGPAFLCGLKLFWPDFVFGKLQLLDKALNLHTIRAAKRLKRPSLNKKVSESLSSRNPTDWLGFGNLK